MLGLSSTVFHIHTHTPTQGAYQLLPAITFVITLHWLYFFSFFLSSCWSTLYISFLKYFFIPSKVFLFKNLKNSREGIEFGDLADSYKVWACNKCEWKSPWLFILGKVWRILHSRRFTYVRVPSLMRKNIMYWD
jgi:hypothetical protein